MGKAGPIEAAKLITKVLSVVDGPRPTRDLLVEIIIGEGWLDALDAADKADQWLSRFKSRINHEIATCRDDGRFVAYHFNSSGDDYIQGSCFSEPLEPHEIREAKALRAFTHQIQRALNNLDAGQFEKLSGRLLTLLGVERAHISRRSADQGIDFFGRVAIGRMLKPQLLDMGAEKHMYVWLIGQSKHYPSTKVSTAEIRELVGSVELARSKIFAGSSDPLTELTMRICDPTFYMFFTSGTFTRDSKQLMTRAGVLAFEGLQLAQFLADHGIGIENGSFEEHVFLQWVNS